MIEFDCPRKPVFDHCVFVATPRPAGPLKPDRILDIKTE